MPLQYVPRAVSHSAHAAVSTPACRSSPSPARPRSPGYTAPGSLPTPPAAPAGQRGPAACASGSVQEKTKYCSRPLNFKCAFVNTKYYTERKKSVNQKRCTIFVVDIFLIVFSIN